MPFFSEGGGGVALSDNNVWTGTNSFQQEPLTLGMVTIEFGISAIEFDAGVGVCNVLNTGNFDADGYLKGDHVRIGSDPIRITQSGSGEASILDGSFNYADLVLDNLLASSRIYVGTTASIENNASDEVYFKDEAGSLGIKVNAKQFDSDTTGSSGGILFNGGTDGQIYADAGAGGRLYIAAGAITSFQVRRDGLNQFMASATPLLIYGPGGAYPNMRGGGATGGMVLGNVSVARVRDTANANYRGIEASAFLIDDELLQPTGASPTVTLNYQNHSMHRVDLVTNTPSGTPTIQFGSVPRNSLQARGVIVIEQPATALDINWASGDASSFAWLGVEPTWTDDDGQDRLVEYVYSGNGQIYLRDLGVTS